MKSQKGNSIIWVLVVMVILVGIYFVMKANKGGEFNYEIPPANTGVTGGGSVEETSDLSAELDSVGADLDGVDVEGIDSDL